MHRAKRWIAAGMLAVALVTGVVATSSETAAASKTSYGSAGR